MPACYRFRVRVHNALLEGVILWKADLTAADLSHANLNSTGLIETDLSEADLSEASLSGAYEYGNKGRDYCKQLVV